MGKGLDPRIGAIAARRYGLVTRTELLAVGLSSRAVSKRIAAGRLVRRFPGVYVLPGVPHAPNQDLLAALLAVGGRSAISHQAAGAVWQLEGFDDKEVHVLVAHERRLRLAGVYVHRTRTLERRDVVRRGLLVVTTPVRTVIDLAGTLDRVRLEDVLDDALRRRLVSVPALRSRLTSMGCGVPGTEELKRLVEARAEKRVSGSGLENRFRRRLRGAGLPPPVAQHEVRDASGRLIARVDFAYPQARLAIEVDGYAFHSGRRSWEADLARQNKLVGAGWTPIRVTSTDIDGSSHADVFTAIEEILQRRSGTGDRTNSGGR